MTWDPQWKAEPHRIKFLVQGVYDVISSTKGLEAVGKPAAGFAGRSLTRVFNTLIIEREAKESQQRYH